MKNNRINRFLARHAFTARLLFVSAVLIAAGVLVYSGGDYVLSARRPYRRIPAAESRPLVRALPPSQDRRADINLASAEDLQAAGGVGPAIASRIIELRNARGGFYYLEEVLDVPGVGEKRFLALRELFLCIPPGVRK